MSSIYIKVELNKSAIQKDCLKLLEELMRNQVVKKCNVVLDTNKNKPDIRGYLKKGVSSVFPVKKRQ